MNNVDKQYIDLIDKILNEGKEHLDRTGVGTLRIFGHQMKFDLREGFPALTVKRIGVKNTIAELLFFLSGSTNIDTLASIYEPAVSWWSPWADEENNLGPMYSQQFRAYPAFHIKNDYYIDQIQNLIHEIKTNPNSRRLLFTSYNPADAPRGALYPCHSLIVQMQVEGNILHSSTLSRSVDTMLGLPHNIASAAIFQHMVAQVCNLQIGDLTFFGNDIHIYLNHIEGAREVLRRGREERMFSLPQLKINPSILDINNFSLDDIRVNNYVSHPSIKLPIAV